MKEPLSVLVVDDDPAGRAMLSLTLRQGGLSVQTASGGEEAMRFLRQMRFDTLVTDARMHPMDGFELSLRAKKIQPDLRILMISAVYAEQDAKGFPVDKFFPKPVPIDNMLHWLSAPSA